MLTVYYDFKRTLDCYMSKSRHFGITRYVSELWFELRKYNDNLNPVPVLCTDIHPFLADAELIVPSIEEEIGEPVNRLWTSRPGYAKATRIVARLLRKKFKLVPGKTMQKLRYNLGAKAFSARNDLFLEDEGIFHSPFNHLPARSVTRNLTRVITIHDLLHYAYPEMNPTPTNLPYIYRILENLDKERDFVICDSECTRRDLLASTTLPESHARVVYLAANPLFTVNEGAGDDEFLRARHLRRRNYLVAFAQSEPRKNMPRLVRALAELNREGKLQGIIPVFIAPNKNQQAILETHMNYERFPKEGVRILTDVADEELAALYRHAVCLAYPSLYEGFGLPPLEAMACGCPVVVSNGGSLQEVVADAGMTIDARNTREMAAGIRTLLDDAPLRKEFAAKGVRRAAMFSNGKMCRDTVESYHAFLAIDREKRARV